MPALEFVLHAQVNPRIHTRVMQPTPEFWTIGIGADTAPDLRLSQQRCHSPLFLSVLVQDIPFHLATYQGFQRFLEVVVILAVEVQHSRQILDRDVVLLLGGSSS